MSGPTDLGNVSIAGKVLFLGFRSQIGKARIGWGGDEAITIEDGDTRGVVPRYLSLRSTSSSTEMMFLLATARTVPHTIIFL